VSHKKPKPAPEHFPVVVISDTHLGINNGPADLLCEFLRHTTCDKLILNGDIIDGVRLNVRRPREFSEAHKRVMDAINRKIAEGTEVVYIPGNHDGALRRLSSLFGQTVMGLHFERSLDFTDPKGRRFFIAHGDSFDRGQTNPPKLPKSAHIVFDRGYVAATRLSAAIDRVSGRLFKKHFALAAHIRHAIERPAGSAQKHVDISTAYAKKHGYDGVICGHFHQEALRKGGNGALYLNSGDWVESFTALTMDKNGDWSVVKWPDKRRALGLKRHVKPAQENPDAAFRPATEKMLAAIHRLWPGKPPKPRAP
jgi:UDP-2,3-diacylglucosamine pyrophosphatase LpxH